jgi:nucleoside-diphosphate-sugar epimerase
MGGWAGARVFVTGGTGFLGRHLTRHLMALGTQVTAALPADAGPQERTALPLEVDCQECDVRNYGKLLHLIKTVTPGVIFHLAAVGVNDPFISEELALTVNLHGTLNLLQATEQCARGRVRRVIIAGTSYEYGRDGKLDPGNVYAASKVAAWAFCRMYYRAHGTPVVVVRPFNAYGPGQNQRALIPSAIRAALNDQDFPTTPGEQKRDFIYVDDVISGFLAAAMADDIEGTTLDLGTGRATPVRNVVERIFKLTKSAGRPRIGALPYRPGAVSELVADAERTANLTGWRAKVGLDEGLQLTVSAMLNT